MAYSSLTSILLILPGMPQTTSSAGYSETSVVVNRHITRADSIIDGKISRRYTTPITPTPPLVGTLSEDITSYYSYRSFYTQDNYNKSEYFEDLLKLAMTTLNEIANGDIDLVNTSGSVIGEKESGSTSIVDSNNFDYQPFFDVDNPTDWKFDDNLKDEVDGKR